MGGWMDGWTDGWMDGISPHSTGLCPLFGLLPCYPLRPHDFKEAGQENRWPHDAFWQLVSDVFKSIWRESEGVLIRPTPFVPSGGPKMLMQVERGWWVQIVNKAWKFGYKYCFTCKRQPDGVPVEKKLHICCLSQPSSYFNEILGCMNCCIFTAYFSDH